MMTVDMHKVYDTETREERHKKYTSDPYFDTLNRNAYAKGFRHATISEIHSGAESTTIHTADLYCWAGGLWVKDQKQ